MSVKRIALFLALAAFSSAHAMEREQNGTGAELNAFTKRVADLYVEEVISLASRRPAGTSQGRWINQQEFFRRKEKFLQDALADAKAQFGERSEAAATQLDIFWEY